MFTQKIESEKKSGLSSFKIALQHYLNSKLGILYIAMELDRRLQESKMDKVLVNAVHPGMYCRGWNLAITNQDC
jgi:NAD(P)-dependent dehydrogenase (short-subunit alcohol dehydrogenase family)